MLEEYVIFRFFTFVLISRLTLITLHILSQRVWLFNLKKKSSLFFEETATNVNETQVCIALQCENFIEINSSKCVIRKWLLHAKADTHLARRLRMFNVCVCEFKCMLFPIRFSMEQYKMPQCSVSLGISLLHVAKRCR